MPFSVLCSRYVDEKTRSSTSNIHILQNILNFSFFVMILLFILGEIKIKQMGPYGSVEFSGHLEVTNVLIHNFNITELENLSIFNLNSFRNYKICRLGEVNIAPPPPTAFKSSAYTYELFWQIITIILLTNN